MKYESQRVAVPYFVLAVLLFGLQVIFGLILGAKYVWDFDPLISLLPFNQVRAIHINLLVFWLLLGFMGGTYYIVAEESDTEIWSRKLAIIQFWIFAAAGVGSIAAYLSGRSWGMPFLEQPTVFKLAIVAGALIFLYNILRTMMQTKKWTAIQGVLLAGLVALALLFLFGIFRMKNLTTQYYYWWWVIHLWVEGAWELITAAIMAFILLKITGVERSLVEKWLYIEVGFVLFTGIVGTGHHYYWIGTPHYWLWVGGVFSALEPLPILFMVLDTVRVVREKKLEVSNKLVLHLAVGCAVLHLLGAGVWGFAHTLPQINQWTHGTQVTASHGHFAFFGAYAMLNFTLFYYALPQIKSFREYDQKRGFWAYYIMASAMIFMVLGLAVAGIVQAYLQRVLGMDYMIVQGYMRLWFAVFWTSAWVFAFGAFLFIYDFFTLKEVRN